MIINMVGGGGGAALNFKVVPGLTQPGTASENTIWVKTEKIGAWYFSATQPEGLQEWDVWFLTGTESDVEFNALRKNGLQVYPISAKQYVSGELKDVTAMSYQGGEWVELVSELWLFKAGDLCSDKTGGWSHSTNYGSVTFPGSYAIVSANENQKRTDMATVNTIDVSSIKTLFFELRSSSTYPTGYPRVGIAATRDADTSNESMFVASVTLSKTTEITTVSLDVSSVTGSYYVIIGGLKGTAGGATIEVFNVWGKKI